MSYSMQRGETVSLNDIAARKASSHTTSSHHTIRSGRTAHQVAQATLLAKNDMRGMHMAMRSV